MHSLTLTLKTASRGAQTAIIATIGERLLAEWHR